MLSSAKAIQRSKYGKVEKRKRLKVCSDWTARNFLVTNSVTQDTCSIRILFPSSPCNLFSMVWRTPKT